MPAALSSADEEGGAVKRFGLLYGTLVEHAASGERFTVEWSRDDDRVWYDILVAHFLFEDGTAARAALEAGIEVLAERECSFSD